eukprot:gnl/TRDRNA2_/TRDRNA2_89592_c0_seq1.p1 gnl/TRDRNA2_/TRDRNA2_89592_c0~~gnl/TRDRNA2_/TRDRNA2_89592_c0_seq1.p1  ORF type:complete len:386 (-),score=99.26 gnl/TRDRNA2_/TRDRNA2_89592_c0_seq1:270-1427(-)
MYARVTAAARPLLAWPVRRGASVAPSCFLSGAGLARTLVTYAADPNIWQADPDVQAYGQLLAVQDERRADFAAAVAKLRTREDLPADLRASAGRLEAGMHFRHAISLLPDLRVTHDAPWPELVHEEVLESAVKSCNAYAASAAESVDAELLKELAPVCPEWPAAVAAAAAAHTQARKLRAELRMQEIAWVARQAQRARAARQGDGAVGGAAERKELRAAGLPGVREEELWARAARAAEMLVKECEEALTLAESPMPTSFETLAEAEGEEALKALYARGRSALVMLLKDLAVACACTPHEGARKLEEATGHLTKALDAALPATEGGDAADLTENDVEQIRAAVTGMLELCKRQMAASENEDVAQAAVRCTTLLANALAKFNTFHRK